MTLSYQNFCIVNEIKKWHEKTFPDITMTELLLKLEEEFGELYRAINIQDYDSVNEEMADVFIVSAALDGRFNSKIGMTVCNNTLQSIECESIMDAVKKKMKENKKRKWHKVDGIYRHKEEE